MSFSKKIQKIFKPDENQTNYVINNSIIGYFYNLLTRMLRVIAGSDIKNSFIIKHLNNLYFFILVILIFAIPFATSNTLGVIASILIVISILNSIFKHRKFVFSTIHIPVIIYLIIMFISVFFSELLMPSLKGFSKMLIYIGAFFSFFEFLKRNPKQIFPVIVFIAISCSFELLFSLKQMIFGVEELASWQDKTTLNPENMVNRVFGTLKPFNPNLFSAYLLATTPCIIISSVYALFKRRKNIAITFGIFSLLALITIVQTGCRGGYIGLFFGTILFCILTYLSFKKYIYKYKKVKKIIWLAVFGAVILGCLALILSPAILHRLSSIFALRADSSNSYRMNVYASSLKMFLDHPIIGIGPGNTTYRLIYGLYMVTGFDALGAYNIYLEMAVESGIFALLTFLWMMLLTFTKSIKRIFTLRLKLKLVIVACLSAIFAMLMHGFFDTVWYRPQLQLLFWLYLAILAVLTMRSLSYEQ